MSEWTDDLVDQLRSFATDEDETVVAQAFYKEAADEIERLRALCRSICAEAGFDPADWPIKN